MKEKYWLSKRGSMFYSLDSATAGAIWPEVPVPHWATASTPPSKANPVVEKHRAIKILHGTSVFRRSDLTNDEILRLRVQALYNSTNHGLYGRSAALRSF